VLQIDDMQFHIDPGPGALVRAKEFGINPRGTTAVLVSHNHLNHSNDVNAVIDAMTLGGFDKKGVLIANQSTIQGDKLHSPAVSGFHHSCLERVIQLSPGQKAALEDVEIHAFAALHTDPTALGFKILAPRFTLGYSGDTAYSKDVAAALDGCDILILNVTFPEATKTDCHLNRADAVKIIEKVKPKLAIITHFGFDMLKADPLQEARHMHLLAGVQVVAAHDGMVLSPQSYAAHSKQARLTTFVESEKAEQEKSEVKMDG